MKTSDNMSGKVMVISGGSRGIGAKTAELYIKKGYRVYELSRNGGAEGGVHIRCDISSESDVAAAFAEIGAREESIDVLVCNAGFGISGAVEFTEIKEAKSQFDVNFFGNLSVIRNALPLMREKGGNIIAVSSVAAVFAIPYQSFYSATKAGINVLCQALANEVRPFGISVAAVMPGDIKTDFTSGRKKNEKGSEIYKSMKRSVAVMEKDEENGMPPEKVANLILKLGEKKKLRPLYTVGAKYKLFVFLAKLLPSSFYNRIVGKMYG